LASDLYPTPLDHDRAQATVLRDPLPHPAPTGIPFDRDRICVLDREILAFPRSQQCVDEVRVLALEIFLAENIITGCN
jgi:hypothetical protein